MRGTAAVGTYTILTECPISIVYTVNAVIAELVARSVLVCL